MVQNHRTPRGPLGIRARPHVGGGGKKTTYCKRRVSEEIMGKLMLTTVCKLSNPRKAREYATSKNRLNSRVGKKKKREKNFLGVGRLKAIQDLGHPAAKKDCGKKSAKETRGGLPRMSGGEGEGGNQQRFKLW